MGDSGPDASKDDQISAPNRQQQLLILLVVSGVCATTALATASYAVWLSRHQAMRETLTSVHDLLDACQRRMSQMEQDITRFHPNAAT